MEELAELEVLSIQKNDAEVNTAIYLLLENVEKANICYKQIEKKKAFKSFRGRNLNSVPKQLSLYYG